MRAVVCDRLGDPSVLKIEDVPVPAIGPADVLIKVGAASVNFPDVLMLTAAYQHKPELPFIPGMEGAGTISAVGDDVTGWRAGDRVIFGVRPGAFAEYVRVPASGNLMRLPSGCMLNLLPLPIRANTRDWTSGLTNGFIRPMRP